MTMYGTHFTLFLQRQNVTSIVITASLTESLTTKSYFTCGMFPHVVWYMFTDVSEECTNSMLIVITKLSKQ
jgi:hypothetical protein